MKHLTMPLKVQIQIVAMTMEKMNRKSNGKATKISFGKGGQSRLPEGEDTRAAA